MADAKHMPGAEEALSDSEERLRLAQDLAQIGTFDWNMQTGVNVWTPRLEAMHGLPPGGFAGTQEAWEDLLHPDDRLGVLAHVRESFETNQAGEGEWRVVWPDGSMHWLLGRWQLFRDLSGKPLRLTGVNIDITGRKQAEQEVHKLNDELEQRVRERTSQLEAANEALRESKERLRLHIENSPMAVVEWDSKFIVVRWAGEAENIFGWSAAETVGKPIMDLHMIYDEDISIVQRTMEKLTDGISRHVVSHNRNYTKDGRVIHCSWYNSIVLNKEGRMSSVLSFVLDNTARMEAEEQRVKIERRMLQTQRLESLGVLAGGVAHDFNNILTVILGNAELALDDLPASASSRDSVRQIVAASHRASELCRQMLAYAGKGQIAQETIDIQALIKDIVSLLHASISKKALLTLHLEKDLPPMTGDPTQLQQILMNLVINASEAIGESGGVVAISTSIVDYPRGGQFVRESHSVAYGEEDLPPGRYLCLEVSDTGCGMDRETLERLFEPFFTTKFTGRGLGLSAVLGIVRAHKGAVNVRSEPGMGTTVEVLFPALESKGAEESKVQAFGALDFWRGSGTILLVDDEDYVRDVCGQMLERLGFGVITAADGYEALELFRQRRKDICLVMLDLTMPHMDGEETFNELRAVSPDLPVVLLTGYSEKDIASRFAGKGLSGFMQKPHTLAALGKLLSGLLPAIETVE